MSYSMTILTSLLVIMWASVSTYTFVSSCHNWDETKSWSICQ